MRVIEPRFPRPINRSKHRRTYWKLVTVLLLMVVLAGGAWYMFGRNATIKPTVKSTIVPKTTPPAPLPPEPPKKGTLRTFTAQQFRDLYNSFVYPNTERISEGTPIVGDETVDEHIRALAVARGYTIRSAPVTDVFQEVAPGMRLQQRAAQPWLDLQAAAQKDGISLGLSAAYRSAAEQTQLFTKGMVAAGINLGRLSTGTYDLQLGKVLETTAIPGYSRHHTGYTVDITCGTSPAASFVTTDCFTWLSADNYKHAKTYGWIPSYPEGTGQQGPEPEAWEYVWVGTDSVTE